MSRLENPKDMERIVGVERHATVHFGLAVSADPVAKMRLYILHSKECVATGLDLRECLYSIALDLGLDVGLWKYDQDRPVVLAIDPVQGDLLPALAEVVGEDS